MGRGAWEETGQRSVTITAQKAPGKQETTRKDSAVSFFYSDRFLLLNKLTPIMPGLGWPFADDSCPQLSVLLRPSILCRRPDCEAAVVTKGPLST